MRLPGEQSVLKYCRDVALVTQHLEHSMRRLIRQADEHTGWIFATSDVTIIVLIETGVVVTKP